MSNLPKKTLAAILVEQKKPLEIAEINLPETLDIGQVLVEFAYSGICGSQIGEIEGVKGPDKWLPHLLGHEASGKVLAVGPGVKHVKPSDTVVAHWRPSRGIEATTPKYDWEGKIVNAGWVTTFNKHAVVSENRLTRIPPNTDLKTAALYGCAVTTGYGVVDNRAKVKLGESVVIFGSGGVGLNIVQAAYLAGARRIVAVDVYENRLELASKCGATHLVSGLASDVWNQIARIFDGDAPEVFIDNTGDPEVIAKGYNLVKQQGRVVLVGVPKIEANTSLHTLQLHFGKSLVGTDGGEALPQFDIARYMALVEARRIELAELITEVASLRDINHLIAGMRNGSTAGRCLVDFLS